MRSPPGRPLGSQEAITNNIFLSADHFAFLRACVQGIDPSDAANRYLLLAERIDKRTAKATYRHLLAQVLTLSQEIGDSDAIAHAQDLQKEPLSQPKPACTLSFDDFAAAQGGHDFYAQNELEALYLEHVSQASIHLDHASLKTKLRALEALQIKLARAPKGSDGVGMWLSASFTSSVRAHGVLSLNELVIFINTNGRTWHRKIKRLGKLRAARINQWIREHLSNWAQKLDARIFSVAGAAISNLSNQNQVIRFALVPIEQLDVPVHLNGATGGFRRQTPNTLNASTDLQAIQAWFKTSLATKSRNTVKAYEREIERFYLWCLLEAGKPLSSVNQEDCLAFRKFILNPPPHWISTFPAKRGSLDWRPFKGPLDPVSAGRTLSAVSSLFRSLSEAGYLAFNPMPSIASPGGEGVKMDVARSFTDKAKQVIKDTLNAMGEGITKRRLKAFFALMLTSGLRLDEALSATLQDLEPMRINNQESGMLQLRVLGKGNRERIIPLREDVTSLISTHQRDFDASFDIEHFGASPRHLFLGFAGHGLKWHVTGRAWSKTSAHASLKKFFNACLMHPLSSQLDFDFREASAHWLRHTFAHNILEKSGDLVLAQQLLGHQSLQSTQIYVKSNLEKRSEAVLSLGEVP